MIFSAIIVYTFISNIFLKEKNIFTKTYLRSILTILILLILYIPINYIFGENLILTLIILFISILLSEIITHTLLTNNNKKLNIICAILLIINFIIFALFTYFPPKFNLFLDKKNNKYGIDILNK